MNQTQKPMRRNGKRIAVFLILAAILALFAFFLKSNVIPLIKLELQNDVNGAHELLADRGWQGALSVILIEALQMVVIFIPAEFIQISSGLSYPVFIAVPLCDLGVCLGATIIFLLVRCFRFRSEAYEKRRQKIERLSANLHERNTMLLLYLLFFMPIIPFGAICYYGSSRNLSYPKYLLTVATGVIPSILVSNLMGAAGSAFLVNDLPIWLLVLIIVVLACALFALILLFMRRYIFRAAEGTPDSMMYAFIFFVVRLWLGRTKHVKIDDELLHGVEAPYILLSNHESFEDFYYISQMAHPRNPSFLVNEFYCTRPILKHMPKKAGIVSKKLFTRDMSAAAGILRTIRKGYPIVIFPEGRLSPDGRSNPIVEDGAALYRRLKTTLVLVKIDGAYYAHPKWRGKKYRTPISVRAERVIRPDELAALSDAELGSIIRDTLYNDASAHTETVYRRKDRAEGLDTLLYRCMDCGALYTTAAKGNTLFCRACGREHSLDEQYHFIDAPYTIPAWYDAIRRMEEKELPAFSLHAAVETKIFGANGGPVRTERGECFLDPIAFRYLSETEDFSIPVRELPALAFSCGKEFELYHADELHYFYPAEDPKQVARWALFVDLMAEKRQAQAEIKGENADGKAE